MKQPRQRTDPKPRPFLFRNPKPTTLWKRLPAEHQQVCRQVLGQLLQQILRHERTQPIAAPGSNRHE